jgi:molybdate transport system ATP-binding protein
MITIDILKKLNGTDGDLNLKIKTTIQRGELVTLYGPNGAGKSSVIRMIAGLMEPDEGTIVVGKDVWFDKIKGISIKPQQRKIGMVFQEYSLFPNMTVRANLEYALEKNQNDNIIDELLEVVEMKKLEDKKPSMLSGGQKQRIGLIRALVRRPHVLLLDEPLSALDHEMRVKLQDYILDFHHQFNLTTILVSHDFPEVLKMSKRVLVIEKGVIKQDTVPEQILR